MSKQHESPGAPFTPGLSHAVFPASSLCPFHYIVIKSSCIEHLEYLGDLNLLRKRRLLPSVPAMAEKKI